MPIIAVYGSLRKGLHLHHMLGHIKKTIGTGRLGGYELYDTGFGFPTMVKGQGEVVVELYEIKDECFKNIHQVEHNAGYTMMNQNIIINNQNTLINYFIMSPEEVLKYFGKEIKKVEHGDWNKHISEGYRWWTY